MKVYNIICELYTEFYKQVSLNRNFVYIPMTSGPKRDQLIICRFIKFIKEEYGEQADINFLINFFKFQFSHYSGVQTKYGKNAIMIHWIIGQTAIKRWKDRDVRKNWIVKVKLKNEVELKLVQTYNKIIKQNSKTNEIFTAVHAYEERDKSLHHNTKFGFQFCLYTTTLYNPASEYCCRCDFKNQCEKMLQSNHPKLYKMRIDG